MAADKTAVKIAHATLVANTLYTFNLTGDIGFSAEVFHHGDDTDVVYAQVAYREADLTSFALGDSEIECVGAGERLTVAVPPSGCWVRVRSAGTPTVTVRGL